MSRRCGDDDRDASRDGPIHHGGDGRDQGARVTDNGIGMRGHGGLGGGASTGPEAV